MSTITQKPYVIYYGYFSI